MYVFECVTDADLSRVLEAGWRVLREEEPLALPPDPAGETWKRQLVNDLLLANYGEQDPSTGQLAAYCYPAGEPFVLLSLSELKQRRLVWDLRPSQAQFSGGMLVLVRDGQVQVRLPLQEKAADDLDFWRRVWVCLHILAKAKLHVYDVQLERTLDLRRDQEAVRQEYRGVADDIFAEDEEDIFAEDEEKDTGRGSGSDPEWYD